MKTTIEISDALFERARRHAKRSGLTFRAVVEEGLRRVVNEPPERSGYELADLSVGDPCDPNPLEALSWQDLRETIYGR